MQVLQHKVVASLPVLLQPNSIYYVRNGTGYDQYITNGVGTVAAYALNITVLDQTTGQSKISAMSQKAVTDNLDSLGDELATLRQELNDLKLILNPPEIGDEVAGGFYIGDITIPGGDDAGTYMIIMTSEKAVARWKYTETSTANTDSSVDGKSNTLAMVNAGISEHPAAEHCVNYRGGGFDDWYLPSRNEVELVWENRSLLRSLSMKDHSFWTSTQLSSTEAREFSHLSMKFGSSQKTGFRYARPIRRIKKQ